MYLVVGLGNPGKKYTGSRHNVGFMAADELARRLEIGAWKEKFKGLLAETRYKDEKLRILKPQTFMNLSGESVYQAKRFYKTPIQYIIVVHDELDIPLGTMRVKAGGGSAGHKGLESIIRWLGTGGFIRVRIGIGKPPGKQGVITHVLSSFTKSDKPVLEETIILASDAVLKIVSNGVESAMNAYNRKSLNHDHPHVGEDQ